MDDKRPVAHIEVNPGTFAHFVMWLMEHDAKNADSPIAPIIEQILIFVPKVVLMMWEHFIDNGGMPLIKLYLDKGECEYVMEHYKNDPLFNDQLQQAIDLINAYVEIETLPDES